jgi:two-component system NtrC family response regulator
MGEGVLISEQDLDLFSEKISRNLNLRENIRKVESVLLNEALSVADGNISKVSKLMGISRPQVYTLINIHKVQS